MSLLPLSGQVYGIKDSLRRGPSLRSHILHNCGDEADWLDQILRSLCETHPECLSKQKITSLVGSRAHHSFPWSQQKNKLTEML